MSPTQTLKEIRHKAHELIELCFENPDLGESTQILEALRQIEMEEEYHVES